MESLNLFTISYLVKLKNNQLPYWGTKTLLKRIDRLPDKRKTIDLIWEELYSKSTPENLYYRETTKLLIKELKEKKLW